MANKPVTIDSILGGISTTDYVSAVSVTGSKVTPIQYGSSVGIDPEQPLNETAVKVSGMIVPTAFETISSGSMNNHPVAIITTPVTDKIYSVLAGGRILQYDSDLTNETNVGEIDGVAEGAWYYNNFIIISTPTDLSAYGPLSGTPAITNNIWTTSVLGTQTALTDNDYPSLLGTGHYPKHVGYTHVDNKAYFLDYKDGQGMVHFMKTDKDYQNSGSTYNALDLPYGYYPTSVCGYGNDLVVFATQIVANGDVNGISAAFIWDTVSDSFHTQVPLTGVCTAGRSISGVLMAWSGSISGAGGHTVYHYAGENVFSPITSVPEGYPPTHGAVDYIGGRAVWGSFLTDPIPATVVWAYGSKDGTLPPALHCIAKSNITHTDDDGIITAVKYALQGTFSRPILLFGGKSQRNYEYKLEAPSDVYGTTVFRSQIVNIGQKFTINKLTIPLGKALNANTSANVRIYVDDGSSYQDWKPINSTTCRTRKYVDFTSINGENNFFIEITNTGTELLSILLPIKFEVNINDE